MFALRIRHNDHRGANPTDELRHFPGVTDPGLHDRSLHVGREPQQCPGNAHRIVVITFGSKHRFGAERHAENGGNHLRRRRFAIAAHHANERNRKLTAPSTREGTVGFGRIRHDNFRHRCSDGAFHDEEFRPVALSRSRVIMTVELVAL